MRYVEINDVNLFEEYGLILKHYELEPLTPNLFQTEVTGKTGIIDFTEFYGDLTYKNRNITIKLLGFYDEKTQFLKYVLESKYAGKEVKVSFSDDDECYWKGRLMISKMDDNCKKLEIEMKVNAHPFKFRKLYDTEVRQDV